ncbi:MAG: iron-sulfur cluster assembly scaffold protein [Desulfatibacillum sp.]|nr:iron-sulfur cluster assembly scaffold protein [Desulfatibacillum sp.]
MEREPIPERASQGFDPRLMKKAGYSPKAIQYFAEQPNRGVLADANQVTEMAGPCGDSITIYLRVKEGRVDDARALVTGCPGAMVSAMAAMELVKGKTLNQALAIEEKDIFRALEELPDEKQDCVQLCARVLHQAVEDYVCSGPSLSNRE